MQVRSPKKQQNLRKHQSMSARKLNPHASIIPSDYCFDQQASLDLKQTFMSLRDRQDVDRIKKDLVKIVTDEMDLISQSMSE